MDSNCTVKIFFCDSFKDSNCKSLGDFACLWAEEMKTDHFVVLGFIDYHLRIAVLSSIVVKIPFKWLKDWSVGDDVICTELCNRILLTVSTASIFDWREDSGGDKLIAHFPLSCSEKSICEKFASHDCGWSQL